MKTFVYLLLFCLCVVSSRVSVADDEEQVMSILESLVREQGQSVAIILMNMTQDVLKLDVGLYDPASIIDAMEAQKRLMAKLASWPEEDKARVWIIDVRSRKLKWPPFGPLMDEARRMWNYRLFEFTPQVHGGRFNNYFMADEPLTKTPSKDLPLRTYREGDSLDLVRADTFSPLSKLIEQNGLNHFFVMGQGTENSVAQMVARLIVEDHEVYVALSYSVTLKSAPGEDIPATAAAARRAKKKALYEEWLALARKFKHLKVIGGLSGDHDAMPCSQ